MMNLKSSLIRSNDLNRIKMPHTHTKNNTKMSINKTNEVAYFITHNSKQVRVATRFSFQ